MNLRVLLVVVTVARYDIIVDATDNVAARYMLSDACVLLKKPFVSAAALRFEGQAAILL